MTSDFPIVLCSVPPANITWGGGGATDKVDINGVLTNGVLKGMTLTDKFLKILSLFYQLTLSNLNFTLNENYGMYGNIWHSVTFENMTSHKKKISKK